MGEELYEKFGQLSRVIDIEGGGFWLNLLKKILVKIGPCKDE